MAQETGAAEGVEFEREVSRLRSSGALGEGGRLLELFDFLAARGQAASPASQAEIAESVFGQIETGADDATVRVYIHRLRKRLEDHYRSLDWPGGNARLTVPAGIYALRLTVPQSPVPPSEGTPASDRRFPAARSLLAAAAILAVGVAAFFIGQSRITGQDVEPNAIWQPLLASPRPTVIIAGDYYLFGEIDPDRPEEGRLIRDFRVDSPTDLVRMQELSPERYVNADDVGLNYLPFSVAYGVANIVPLLKRHGRDVSVSAASELEPDLLNHVDVVYVGLFSGMHLLEDINFTSSDFQMGMSYDELVDTRSGHTYVSGEARNRVSSAYYDDYGYVARFRAPSGALVYIVAGSRDTGLRGIAPIVVDEDLPDALAEAASEDAFEALFQITGQKGADLSERLLIARERPAQR